MSGSEYLRRRRRRAWRRVAAFAIVALIVAAVSFALPPVAGFFLRRTLDFGERGSSTCTVVSLSPFGCKLRDVQLGALPSAPRVDSLEVRFTPWGLLRGDISSMSVSGAADLGEVLGPDAANLLPEQTTKLWFDLMRWPGVGYRGTLRGELLGGRVAGLFTGKTLFSPAVELTWSPAVAGVELPQLHVNAGADCSGGAVRATAKAFLEGCPWKVEASAESHDGAFEAVATLPDGVFDLGDSLVAPLVEAFAKDAVALESLSGSVTGIVHCAKTADAPVPEWDVGVRVTGLSAAGKSSSGTKFAVSGGRAWLPVKGYGAHYDIKPYGILFDSAAVGDIAFGRGSFWFRTDAENVLLTEGSLELCGGVARVYALHMNLERLDAGFTLMLDDLDAGEVLALFPGVRGSATGRLYGKLPLSLRGGREVRLRNAFLYSPPGQGGRLELQDASAVVDNLAAAGVPSETCRDLEKALRALDWDSVRMDLTQDRNSGEGRLSIKLEGSSKDGPAQVPVKLELNFDGAIQDMLNIGLRAATM